MAFDPGHCASCGTVGDVHEHHLVPRAQGGSSLPTVYLCVPCHAAVHDRRWNAKHVALTRDGLAAAKARGVKLGGDRGYRPLVPPNGKLGGEAVRRQADQDASRVICALEEIKAAGGPEISLQGMARALTERGIATPRGGAWTATAVRRVLARA